MFFGYLQSRYYGPIRVVIFSAASILNMLGAVLNVFTWLDISVLALVLYLCGPFLSILMSLLRGFPTSGIPWGCDSGVSTFFLVLVVSNFSVFGITVKFLLLIGPKKYRIFAGFTGGISS